MTKIHLPQKANSLKVIWSHVLIFPESKHLQIRAGHLLNLPFNPTMHKKKNPPPSTFFSQGTEFRHIKEEKKNSQCLTNFSKGKQFSFTNWHFQTNKREQDKNLPSLHFPSLRLFHFLTGSVASFQNNLLVTKIMSLGPYIYCTY